MAHKVVMLKDMYCCDDNTKTAQWFTKGATVLVGSNTYAFFNSENACYDAKQLAIDYENKELVIEKSTKTTKRKKTTTTKCEPSGGKK